MPTDKILSPEQIFFRSLDRLERFLSRAKRPRAFKEAEFSQVVRAELFKLEGWAKLHRHWPIKKEAKIFAQIREQAKRFEDQLGILDLDRSISSDMTSKSQIEIATLFALGEIKARQDLKHLLKHESWFVRDDGETRIEKMRRHLSSVDWPKERAQIDFVRAALVREVSHVSERYRSEWKPALAKSPYDRKILETSLHEWRRQLRWIAIYLQTADGIFGLAPAGEILTAEKKKLIAEYGANPFAKLPIKKSTDIFVDRVAYLELTRLIDRLGSLKTSAEQYFNVRELLVKKGETQAGAADRARALYGDVPIELPVEIAKLMTEYEKFKPLAYLAESL